MREDGVPAPLDAGGESRPWGLGLHQGVGSTSGPGALTPKPLFSGNSRTPPRTGSGSGGWQAAPPFKGQTTEQRAKQRREGSLLGQMLPRPPGNPRGTAGAARRGLGKGAAGLQPHDAGSALTRPGRGRGVRPRRAALVLVQPRAGRTPRPGGEGARPPRGWRTYWSGSLSSSEELFKERRRTKEVQR